MCDYSLHTVAWRPAKVGDRLISTRFCNSVTRGFSEVGKPNIAVCLLPGTEVAFEKEVEYQAGWFAVRGRRIPETVAVFRQINVDNPIVHHDALEFANGEVVLLNDLREDQLATVLQLPVRSAVADPERKEEMPVVQAIAELD